MYFKFFFVLGLMLAIMHLVIAVHFSMAKLLKNIYNANNKEPLFYRCGSNSSDIICGFSEVALLYTQSGAIGLR